MAGMLSVTFLPKKGVHLLLLKHQKSDVESKDRGSLAGRVSDKIKPVLGGIVCVKKQVEILVSLAKSFITQMFEMLNFCPVKECFCAIFDVRGLNLSGWTKLPWLIFDLSYWVG